MGINWQPRELKFHREKAEGRRGSSQTRPKGAVRSGLDFQKTRWGPITSGSARTRSNSATNDAAWSFRPS
jgi:hypothetical protein